MFVGHCITTQANSIIIPSKESYSEGGKRHRRLFYRPQNGFLDRGTGSGAMQCISSDGDVLQLDDDD